MPKISHLYILFFIAYVGILMPLVTVHAAECSKFFFIESKITSLEVLRLPEVMRLPFENSTLLIEAIREDQKLHKNLIEKGLISSEQAVEWSRKVVFDKKSAESVFSAFIILEMLSRGESLESALRVVENFSVFSVEEQSELALSVAERMLYFLEPNTDQKSLDKYIATAELFELSPKEFSRFVRTWDSIVGLSIESAKLFVLDEIGKFRQTVVIGDQFISTRQFKTLKHKINNLSFRFPMIQFTQPKAEPSLFDLVSIEYNFLVVYRSHRGFENKSRRPRFLDRWTSIKELKTNDLSILNSLSQNGRQTYISNNLSYFNLQQLKQILTLGLLDKQSNHLLTKLDERIELLETTASEIDSLAYRSGNSKLTSSKVSRRALMKELRVYKEIEHSEKYKFAKSFLERYSKNVPVDLYVEFIIFFLKHSKFKRKYNYFDVTYEESLPILELCLGRVKQTQITGSDLKTVIRLLKRNVEAAGVNNTTVQFLVSLKFDKFNVVESYDAISVINSPLVKIK